MSSNPVYNTQKVSLQASLGYIARPYTKISNSLESYVSQPKLESNSVLQKRGSILSLQTLEGKEVLEIKTPSSNLLFLKSCCLKN